jgi:hypothetical protein
MFMQYPSESRFRSVEAKDSVTAARLAGACVCAHLQQAKTVCGIDAFAFRHSK